MGTLAAFLVILNNVSSVFPISGGRHQDNISEQAMICTLQVLTYSSFMIILLNTLMDISLSFFIRYR